MAGTVIAVADVVTSVDVGSGAVTVPTPGAPLIVAIDGPVGGLLAVNWGGISGTLTDQADLQAAQVVQDAAIALNTSKVSYDDAAQVATNTGDISTIQTEQTAQDALIALNTAKTGITAGQAAEIAANTSKVSYDDAAQVASNTSDISTLQGEQTTQDGLIAANTAKTGITAGQAAEIAANTLKVSYTDAAEVASNTSDISTLQGEQTTQDGLIAANTAKTGITAGQAAEIAANTLKVTYDDAAIVATAIQPSDTVADLATIPATTQSGTTYTLALADEFSTVMLSNAALVTVTVPTNASVAFPTGTQISLQSLGAGGVTLTTTSLTLNGSSPNTTIAQNEVMVLEKTGTDTWSIHGATAA